MNQTYDPNLEIAETRLYKAPKELLLRMWANPEHLSNWWGPNGFTTTTHEFEFRTGGIWRFTMHGPDGTDYPNVVRYRLVSADRIEYEHVGADELVNFQVAIAFSERDGGTEMDFRMTFPTADERRRVVEEFGADKGLVMTMARLDNVVSTVAPGEIELVIVRRFKAPIDRVWHALTDADEIKKWACPHGLTLERSEGEFRPGGRWADRMVAPNGYAFEVEGEYLEIKPKSLFRQTHRWKKDDGTYKPTTIASYHLHEHEGATTLTFIQTGFWSHESRAAHLGGWSSGFHQLGMAIDGFEGEGVVQIVREFAAPLELVWKCWTEPDRFMQWFAPRPYTCPLVEIDLRPGGTFRLFMRGPGGDEHEMVSEFTDVEPHRSIGWVNSVAGGDGRVAIQGGTNVDFEATETGTRVTVNAYNAALTEQGMMMISGMEMGWNMTLDQLVEIATAG